jgi:hypothetical protein
MDKDRRKARRSQVDEFLSRALATLRSIERLSRGEDADYTEDYVDLVAMKDRLGRRKEDHRLGEIVCCTIESIASNVDSLLNKDNKPRLVRISQASRGEPTRVADHTSVGWEPEAPSVGKSYRLYKADGGVFHSAPVTMAEFEHFQTLNSLYRIEVLR